MNHFKCIKLKTVGRFYNGSLISDTLYRKKAKRAYIRIKELSFNYPINKDAVIYIDDNFVPQKETIVRTNDYVFATIGNTIGKVNVITEEFDGSFISNNTSMFRFNSPQEELFYYELLFRNFIVQCQIEREYTQTGQPKITNISLGNIVIPVLPTSKRKEISDLVSQSYSCFHKSKLQLDLAKQQIELLIDNL